VFASKLARSGLRRAYRTGLSDVSAVISRSPGCHRTRGRMWGVPSLCESPVPLGGNGFRDRRRRLALPMRSNCCYLAFRATPCGQSPRFAEYVASIGALARVRALAREEWCPQMSRVGSGIALGGTG
jgi:hypothetical protein